MKIDNLKILGTDVPLISLSKNETKGLPIGVVVEFYLYRGKFQNSEYLFYQSKDEKEYTPSVYAIIVPNF